MLRLLLPICLTAVLQAQEGPRTGGPFEVKISRPKITYFLYVPEEYEGLISYPVVVALHPASTPAETMAGWWWTEAKQRGYFLLCPQAAGSSWKASDGKRILAALEHARQTYRLDPDRMSLAGYSSGAFMATSWGLAHPELWSCIFAHAGATIPKDLRKAAGKVSVLLSCGSKDGNLGGVRTGLLKLQKAGVTAEFVEYEGMEHHQARPEVWAAACDFMDTQFEALDAVLARARRAREEARWSDAILAYQAAESSLEATPEQEEMARQGLEEVSAKGLELVQKAAASTSKDRARTQLEELAQQLAGTPAGDQARTLLDQLQD